VLVSSRNLFIRDEACRSRQRDQLALAERITSVDKMRFWRGEIPLVYEYTAGVAGEKFLRGLQEGRILAARCGKCGTRYLPPKAYCVSCFQRISNFREVGPAGTVTALAEVHENFDGSRRKKPQRMAYVTFHGVTGGIIHKVSGAGLKVGSRVAPRFRPKTKRTGSLLDIEEFRLVRD
jgi:uncharacterized OB-fold protein